MIFNDGKIRKIDGGTISFLTMTNVIGNFNNDGFTLF